VNVNAHRKVVTVLFCDVVGSTALSESMDVETLQALLASYFGRMSAIVESHGGSVEKFIGDAVMAVFGVPVAHEDDALRACRAALQMRDALPELGIAGRIGVNTGEVLTGTEERLVTGDAVNVAARLEQAAQPGEVLIGFETLRLVARTVEVGDTRLLELKGKSGLVAASPLVTIGEVAARTHASGFVGRQLEMRSLAAAWGRALAGRRSELVTVVGDPGVGKSRLVAEALEKIDARVVGGRCLSYGEGITYWPVVEVVRQLGVRPSDESAARAIGSMLGENDAPSDADEIAWAFRKLLEEQAPLVVCFDDLQWGAETFVDLVESTALLSTDAPLLLLCMARPELLDKRPSWPVTLRLEPLPEQDALSLVGDNVPDAVRQQIVRASGGNPLFLTEMAALSNQDGGAVEVPPSLRALLTARLDQLDEPERKVLERGAVEGELFHRGAVQALAPDETEVTPRLAALVRRELVRPDLPALPWEDAYRFRHLLIRDAAYDALPKAVRADLHGRFADWLETKQTLGEMDELVGYHLEQAVHYGQELGQSRPALALRAGERLAAAGRRALPRDDEAAAGLLARALDLTRPLRVDVNLELDLAQALNEPLRAAPIAMQAAERAAAAGQVASEALARASAYFYEGDPNEPSPPDRLEALALTALSLLEQLNDYAGLAHVWFILGFGVANARTRYDDWAQAIEDSHRYAQLAGRQSLNIGSLWVALIHGSMPVEQALARLDRHDAPSPWLLLCRAWMLALLGRFDEALPIGEKAEADIRERSATWTSDWIMAEIAVLAGHHETAALRLAAVCEWQTIRGLDGFLATYSPMLGRELCVLGRIDEAEAAARRGRDVVEEQDIGAQALWRQVQALVESSRGEHAEAARLAREAVGRLEGSDGLQPIGDALSDLGDVLAVAGRRDEALVAWQDALNCYERKQIVPLAARLRQRIEELQRQQI
jgi:class 3 adenylate cyclase/tetratricopeptide (TPR) repeat protein